MSTKREIQGGHSMFTRTLCCTIAAFSLTIHAYSDSLELQNGDLLQGTFMGGTQNTIRFDVDGTLNTIKVDDVIALTISRGVRPAPSANLAPSAEPAPTVEPMPVAEPVVQKDILAPVGAPLLVRFIDPIDSREHKVGHRFAVQLETDFVHDGRVIAPKGTKLYGVLVDANQAGRLKGKTNLTLELKEIVLNDQTHPIVTSEYNLAGTKKEGKRTGLKVLGGAALGAIIKDDNRAEGALIGAGAGLGVAAITKGEQITVPAQTLIEFQLGAPFTM